MKINDDHLYHGAALTQIAEYPTFKAINAFEPTKGEKSRSAFIVNHDTGIYLKYATKHTANKFKEYVFTFTQAHLDELALLKTKHPRVYIVLVCYTAKGAKEICTLTLDKFDEHRTAREKANHGPEPQYQLLVTAPANKGFRVYMNAPGRKKTSLEQQIVNRNEFPKAIFNGAA